LPRPRRLKAKDLLRQSGYLPPCTINLFLEKRELSRNILHVLKALHSLSNFCEGALKAPIGNAGNPSDFDRQSADLSLKRLQGESHGMVRGGGGLLRAHSPKVANLGLQRLQTLVGVPGNLMHLSEQVLNA
jgi:hypothetical protein